MASFCNGTVWSWTSPVIPRLYGKKDNPLREPIGPKEASIIASLMPLGLIMGPFIFGTLANRIGRKRTILIAVAPIGACYILKAFAFNVYMFYVARLIGGIGCSCIYTVTPMYIGEIAEDRNRGTLGCFLSLFITMGLFYSYAVGPYLSIKWFSLSIIVVVLLFYVLFTLVGKESPYYLVQVDKEDEALECLTRLRRASPYVVKFEMNKIKEYVQESFRHQGEFVNFYNVKGARRAIILTAGLATLQQLCGMNPYLTYMQSIFEQSAVDIPSEICPIIVGGVLIISVAFIPLIIDRIGRKILLLLSSAGTFLANLGIGIHFFLLRLNVDVSYFAWLPLACLIFFMISYNVGIGPLPWVILGEVFAPNMRVMAATLISFLCMVTAFMTILVFPYFIYYIGYCESFISSALICFLGFIFVCFYMPETKGKTLHEIDIMMNN